MTVDTANHGTKHCKLYITLKIQLLGGWLVGYKCEAENLNMGRTTIEQIQQENRTICTSGLQARLSNNSPHFNACLVLILYSLWELKKICFKKSEEKNQLTNWKNEEEQEKRKKKWKNFVESSSWLVSLTVCTPLRTLLTPSCVWRDKHVRHQDMHT